MKVVVARSLSELKAFELPLIELAKNVMSPNVFYESWMLLPAFELLRTAEVIVVFVCSPDNNKLYGVFPLEVRSKYHHLPIRHFSLWRHLHCFLNTPLIRSGFEQICLSAFFDWISKQKLGRYIFQFDQVAAEGPFLQHLKLFTEKNGFKTDVVESYTRPLLRSSSTSESYLKAAISSKHRKDIKKKYKRLEQLGVVEMQIASQADQLDQWVDEFLRLEQSGWKGRSGTAMFDREKEKIFFTRITKNAWNENKLMFFKLSIDEKPIAMRCGFRAGAGVFSFKIAFDEDFAKFSPGLLLEMEHIYYILNHSEIEWVDSCAMPGHTMLDRLWQEDCIISSIAVSTDNIMSKCLVSTISALRHLRYSMRGWYPDFQSRLEYAALPSK